MRSVPLLFLSTLMVVSASSAAAGPALEVSLTLSDLRPQAQDVIYSWDLEVKTPVAASSLKVSLPPGTGGEPRLYLVDGLSSGDLRFDGRNIYFDFDETKMPAGHRVIFAVGGLLNAGHDAKFASSVVLGGHTAHAPQVVLHGGAATRAMVFVTSQATGLSREDPSPQASGPVLMTNEQRAVYSGQTQHATSVRTDPWFAVLLLASLLMIARMRVAWTV